jgi:hydrogenase nickel incorporation protein HypA/HybF
MHELSLAESVVELIEDTARRENFTRVKTVFMEIGKLSCVAHDALRIALDHAARNTCLDGARLEILCVDGAGECPVCGASVTMETSYDCCPQCGAHPLTVLRGTEMRVVELDVE